ncbi:MAG: cation:proton antiporter [Lautropia sp.]|nr:cation:proton antiporter [Lautropia sp.]
MHALELTLILLGASIFMVAVLRRLGLPTLVGYLAVGVLLGPYAGNLAGDSDVVRTLAEFGVVFLMFTLGLEFSVPKVSALRAYVFGLGPAQVCGTIVLVMLAALVLPDAWVQSFVPGGIDWRAALVIGGAVAMSSTALVSKMLTENRELETEHGRRIFGILLFQDLALIPLLIITPALSDGGDQWRQDLGWAVAKAVVLLFVLLRFGPPFMRGWFLRVARMRSHEVFTLNVLLATLLFAWLTGKAGLSMELGAFVAGMLISETEYRYQVEEDIKPFRDLLLGLFFITIGMKLNVAVVLAAWPVVLTLLILPVLLKFALVAGLVLLTRGGAATAVKTGIWLAQAGEFAFVLLALAMQGGLLNEAAMQPMLAAMLLSILASPFLIRQAARIALRVSGQEWLQRSLQLQQIATRSISREKHVILCGYGRSGQSLAHVLESEGIAYVALDLDPDRVRQANKAGEPVVFGDASRRETLIAAGVHRASSLVVTYADTPATLHLLSVTRQLAPTLPVLVRTTSDGDLETLRSAGATEVVPEIVEGSLMLASHALALSGVPLPRVLKRIRSIRDDRYQMLRGYFHGAEEQEAENIEEEHLRLHTITIQPGVSAVGRSLSDLPIGLARVTAVVRAGRRIVDPAPDLSIEAGDTLVLAGTVEQVNGAEASLLKR